MSAAGLPTTSPHRTHFEEETEVFDLHSGYKRLFLQHLHASRRHSCGAYTHPMHASILSPCAYWTSEEKDLFFHALARHSALRPDLIAAEIPSKTVVDVCAYISLLQQGTESMKGEEGDVSFKDLPTASEVSEKWLEYENKQALALTHAASKWELEAKEMRREQMLKGIKNRKPPMKRANPAIRTYEVRAEETNRLIEYNKRMEELQKKWEKEDAVETIDSVDLQVLDGSLRKALEESEFEMRVEAPNSGPTSQTNSDDEISLTNLNQTERRRIQKRLYMRRKRALATGSEVNKSIGRLKTGRKPKVSSSAPPTQSHSPEYGGLVLEEKEESGSEDDMVPGSENADTHHDKTKKKSNFGGKTKLQQSTLKFENHNMTVQDLQEDGMDLFHLRRFGSLMRAYSQDDLESINYSVLKLFRGYMEEWLATVLQQTIVNAEVERQAKEHTRVWHARLDEVKVHHVKQALAILDCAPSKRPLLERSAQRIAGEDYNEDNEMVSPLRNICREAYPPLINHRTLLDPEFELNKPPIDEEAEHVSRLDASKEVDEDERLEAMDMYRSKRQERMLWRLVGMEVPADDDEGVESESNEDEDMEDYDMEELRWATGTRGGLNPILRRAGGTIRSQIYVHSSDEYEADDD